MTPGILAWWVVNSVHIFYIIYDSIFVLQRFDEYVLSIMGIVFEIFFGCELGRDV